MQNMNIVLIAMGQVVANDSISVTLLFPVYATK